VDRGVDPRVFLSAHWAGWVVALRRRHLANVAKSLGPWAKAINSVYSHAGVERRVKVGQRKDGALYIILTNVDLELLGLKQP